jgi:hypothetical protein
MKQGRDEIRRNIMNSALGAVSCLGALLLSSAVMRAGDWQVGVVPGSVGGKYSTLQMDKFGNAHVSYFDESQGAVQYSFWDHLLDKWFNTTLGRCGAFTSLVLDSKQRPHISCPGGGSGSVMHFYWDGSSWKTQPVDLHAVVINYFTSIVLDSNDYPSISYYEENGAGENHLRLRVVTWNGRLWEARTVDSDLGSGKFNSMAMDSKGNPQIAYGNVEYMNASLRFARWNGSGWNAEILEGKGVPGTSMWSVAMVLGKDDAPHIAYTDQRNQIVKYATKRDGKWVLEAVDSVNGVAYPDRNGIALDDQGNPYLSYYDGGRGVLKVAHKQDGKWVAEVIDENFAGFTSSLQISNGNIWVTYASEFGQQLKVARRPLKQVSRPTKSVGAR